MIRSSTCYRRFSMFDSKGFDFKRHASVSMLFLYLCAVSVGCDALGPPQATGSWTGKLSAADVVDKEGLAHRWFMLDVIAGTRVHVPHTRGPNGEMLGGTKPTGIRVLLWNADGEPTTLEPGKRPTSLAVKLNAALVAGHPYVEVDGKMPGEWKWLHSPLRERGGIFYLSDAGGYPMLVRSVKVIDAPPTTATTQGDLGIYSPQIEREGSDTPDMPDPR